MIARPRDTPLAFAALAASGTIWGASFVIGKVALTELSVPHLMLYRFAFASAAFLPFVLRARPALSRSEWGSVLLAAVIGVPVQFLLQFEGLARTTASHAALMIGTAPVLVAIAAYVILRERMRPMAWLALIASTLGVALIVMQTGGAVVAGQGAANPLRRYAGPRSRCSPPVVWIMVSKQLMTRHSPVVVSGLITITGTIILAAWVIARDGPPPTILATPTWLAVAGTRADRDYYAEYGALELGPRAHRRRPSRCIYQPRAGDRRDARRLGCFMNRLARGRLWAGP